MKKIKVLNLFAGIGGNVANLDRNIYDITSIEFDRDIAVAYSRRFPLDHVYICDAYDFLLNHYNEFDFIWASPPCQSHSRAKYTRFDKPYFIDLSLYKVILFLKSWCKDIKWCVENVIPYYEPLINPSYIIERHYLWTNFIVNVRISKYNGSIIANYTVEELAAYHNVDLHVFDNLDIDYIKKRQILRNCCSLGFSDIIDNCFNKENNKKYFQLSLDI